jgi:hypothetical protein
VGRRPDYYHGVAGDRADALLLRLDLKPSTNDIQS